MNTIHHSHDAHIPSIAPSVAPTVSKGRSLPKLPGPWQERLNCVCRDAVFAIAATLTMIWIWQFLPTLEQPRAVAAWLGLGAVALVVSIYLLARIIGRYLGGRLGAKLVGEQSEFGHWYGIALLPQAGVALGMGLVAHNAFPTAGEVILPSVVLATVIFELIGPIGLRQALRRTTPAEN